MTDFIIVGAGPAGVSAATYLTIFGYDVTVIENNKSSLLKSKLINNYYGVNNKAGIEIYESGLVKLEDLNIRLIKREIVSVIKDNNYVVELDNNELVEGKNVVVATGLVSKKLPIKNLDKFTGKGVSYCAVCDGMFYRNKRVGLYGSSAYALKELSILENFTKNITIFTDDLNYKNEKYQVVYDKIQELVGDNHLESIKTSKETVELDGLFIASDSYQTIDFIRHLGIATNDKGEIKVDSNYETNFKGIYAIGDAIGGVKQILKAAHDGMMLAYNLGKKK